MPSWSSNNDITGAPTFVNGMVGAGYANVATAYANTASNDQLWCPDAAKTAGKSAYAPGWVRVKIGTGGRAGRKQYESLVALSAVTTANSANDYTTMP